MVADLINGLFELFGGALLCLNIHRLYKDKKVTGVSWIPVAFFTSWGLWNLYFYPALSCWASFFGGVVVVTANGVWLVMLGYYRYKARSHKDCGSFVKFEGEFLKIEEVHEAHIDLADPGKDLSVLHAMEDKMIQRDKEK